MKTTTLLPLIEEYLAFRRGLGFSLETLAWQLSNFARYAEQVGHQGPITVEVAVGWASAGSNDPGKAARRLSAVRQLARYLATLDPKTEVPPLGLLGSVPHHRQAHIYSDAELSALLHQASLLHPRNSLRPRTYVAFFSLLASTGLRLSEACALERGDVDLDAGILTVRAGKFRKARLVPLHPSATEALARYAADRDACCKGEPLQRFFRTGQVALNPEAVEKTFSRIRLRLGWTAEGRTQRPRIHDLRHSFAVRRLLGWYQEGADLERKVLALSMYLGHAKVTNGTQSCS